MSLGGYEPQESEPGIKNHRVRILGTGAAHPTKVLGAGITVTWVSTGRYRFVWSESPGIWVGMTAGLQATTPADLDSFTAVAGVYDADTRTVDVYVYDATPSLADLAALNWALLTFVFKSTAVAG